MSLSLLDQDLFSKEGLSSLDGLTGDPKPCPCVCADLNPQDPGYLGYDDGSVDSIWVPNHDSLNN